MTPGQLEVLTVALLAGWSCCLPGTWLVLRGSAMLVDAISHTVLLGIVLAFLLSGDLGSPLLRAGAALIGILTVVMVNLLARRPLVRTDAAIGLVFPVLFALAVLLITLLAENVHLDTDVVLTGEIGLAPFDRVEIGRLSVPRSFLYLGAVLLLNASLTAAFWKELKVSSFDPGLAAAMGMSPGAIGLGLVAATSLTAVTAFDSVGSILVVALVVGPPASALLLTRRLPRMVVWSLGLSASAAILG
ncbi:MAG: metal ABC transporter permease, partial [Chloroflexota bacterium]|nr:metal ABC transporter permease [Chloroflexota bacterium]